jgi:phospholipid-translocating ATPase
MKTNTVLVIDGSSLLIALHEFSAFFYSVATKAPAVICCRVSPTQKAVVTKGVK